MVKDYCGSTMNKTEYIIIVEDCFNLFWDTSPVRNKSVISNYKSEIPVCQACHPQHCQKWQWSSILHIGFQNVF